MAVSKNFAYYLMFYTVILFGISFLPKIRSATVADVVQIKFQIDSCWLNLQNMQYFRVLFYVTTCYHIRWTYCDNQPKTGVCIKENPVRSANHDKKYFQVNEFNLLIRRDIFLDKSLLIKSILETDKKIVVITSPRKTGKSVNLNMLEWFFNHILEDSSIVENTRTLSYKFFAEGKVYFDDLYSIGLPPPQVEIKTHKQLPLIAHHKHIIDEYLAKYPVISLRLSIDDGADVYSTFRTKIVELFQQHSYPLATTMEEKLKDDKVGKQDKKIIKEDLKKFKKLSNGTPSNIKTINMTELHTSLLFLSEMLHKHFGQSVIILIDDYCDLLVSELMEFSSHRFREGRLVNLLAKFIHNGIVNNPYLKKAVLTTSLTVARHKLFDKYEDVAFYTAMDNDLYEFYTCTKNEARMLFDYYKINEALARKAFDYYDGYNMKPTSNDTTFNTWTLINFIDKKEPTPFWMDTAGSDFSHNWMTVERFRNTLQSLIDRRFLTIDYTIDINFAHKQAILWMNTGHNEPGAEISGKDIDTFLSYLCHLGYLTNNDHVETPIEGVSQKIRVRILNREVQQRLTEDMQHLTGYEDDLL